MYSFFLLCRPPPTSTLFPYTTLFRSCSPRGSPLMLGRILQKIKRKIRLYFEPRPESLLKIQTDRKSTRLNSSHVSISYAVFCLKKKKDDQLLNNSINPSTR